MIEEAIDHARADLDPRVGPALREAWDELSRSPDFVLFELNDGPDTVRVEKHGKKLLVHVDSDEAVVDVSVPVRTVERILDKL